MKNDLIKVKWLKAHSDFAYFAGDIGFVTPEKAEMLLNGGFIIPLPDEEDEVVNPLPKDLPARDILFEAGFDTAGKVKEAGESITDVKGIGKGTYRQIVAYFEK